MRIENDWSAALQLDRNLWWERQGPIFRFLRDEFGAQQLAQYRARTGFDRNSLVAEPRFADAARRDYRLAAGSPGIEGVAAAGRCGARVPGS